MLILESPWTGLPGLPAIVNSGSQQANGLLAALPLNAGAVDVTGKTGQATATTKFGLDMGRGAQQFDGAQDIRLGSVAEINAATTLTMCAWFRPSSFANAYNTFLSAASSTRYCDLHIKSNGKLALYMVDGSTTGRSYDGTGTFTLSANSLYFLAMTVSSASLRGYVNAELDAEVGVTSGLAARTGGVATVGNNPPLYATRYINGLVRDVRFYNRALTQGELREIYLAGDRLFAPQQIIIPTPAAAAAVPTLSASTYVPGSMTSTGWRPQITAS